jgi:DNA N-6-adenine-methyltransferase Dam
VFDVQALEREDSVSFVATDSSAAETTTWLTPLGLVRSLGEFDLDPCGYVGHPTAKKLIVLPEDGLSQSWLGRVWLNPPYGTAQRIWLKKLQEHGNGIALVFARLETNWIQPFIQDGFFQLQGRISFISNKDFKEGRSAGGGWSAGTGSILIPFGRKNIGAILASDLEGKWFQ